MKKAQDISVLSNEDLSSEYKHWLQIYREGTLSNDEKAYFKVLIIAMEDRGMLEPMVVR